VKPAIEGTLTVLRSAQKTPTVQRVVVTSSVASVVSSAKAQAEPNHVWTSEDWNNDTTVEKEPYRYSKTYAEKAAWEFVREKKHFDIAVLCPSFVLGPPLSARIDSTSVAAMKSWLDGSKEEGVGSPMAFGMIDVRDVAAAHVAAIEHKAAGGKRYLVTSDRAVPHFEMVQWLRESKQFDKYPLPKKELVVSTVIPRYNNAPVQQELGVKLHDPKKTLIEMAHALIQLGIVPKK